MRNCLHRLTDMDIYGYSNNIMYILELRYQTPTSFKTDCLALLINSSSIVMDCCLMTFDCSSTMVAC